MDRGIVIFFLLASLPLMAAQNLAKEALFFNPGDTLSNCLPVVPRPTNCDAFRPLSGFRSINGTCNNLRQRTLGAAFTPLARLLPASYADLENLDTPRGFPGTPSVPTPHEVAAAVFSVHSRNRQQADGLAAMFMAFGQIVDHDIGLTLHPSCDVSAGCSSIKAFAYPCFPIQFERNGPTCTSFARSIPVCQPLETRRTTRQQINELSSYLDFSQVYSNNFEEHLSLRFLDGTGRMRVTITNLLPIKTPESDPSCNTRGGCSLVGDIRGDENIALHIMHTLFIRNHNDIAKKLLLFIKEAGIKWSDELLFQTARKINTAVYQRIVFEEFVPNLVDLHPYQGYNNTVDASIVNVFSTAAFRFGHSLIPNAWAQLNNNFDRLFDDVSLQASFFDTTTVRKRGIEPTMFGLLANQSQNVDTRFAFGVARRLFVPVNEIRHEDLTALNIQKSRDHGLPTYGAWRELCGLSRLRTFSDLRGIVPTDVIEDLRQVYDNPNDIDIFAAGIAETHTNGKMLGPTFQCIQKIQFQRLRDGDRFYYERARVFTAAQQREIQKMTFARVLCNNLDGIVSIQREALKAVTEKTIRIECSRIDDMDLKPWVV